MAKRPVELTEEETDSLLLQSAGKGDREALEALFRRYAEELCRFLVCAGAEAETAVSLVQEVFFDLGGGAARQLPGNRLRVWLFAQACSAWLDQAFGEREERAEASDENKPGDELAVRYLPLPAELWENRATAKEIVDALAPDDRARLALSEVSRLPHAEIAEILAETPREVAQRKAACAETILSALAARAESSGIVLPASPFHLKRETARAVVAYLDGELSAEESAAVESALDANGPESVWQGEILRLRQAIRSRTPSRLSPGTFERIEERLRAERRSARRFRVRLAAELLALVVALGVSAVAWFVSDSVRVDAARARLYRLHVLKSLPNLPVQRSGEPAAWLTVPEGENRLSAANGALEYGLPQAAPLLFGDMATIAPGDAPAHVVLPDGSQVLARGGSRFGFVSGGRGLRMKVESGELWFSFVPQEALLIETPSGLIGSLGGEFDVRVAAPEGAKKPPASQPAGEEALVTQVVVISGGAALEDQTQVLNGETLTLAPGAGPKVVNTRRDEPALEWSRPARETPVYQAVARFTNLRRRLQKTLGRKSVEPLGDIVKGLMAFWPGREADEIAEKADKKPFDNQLRILTTIQLRSVRQRGDRVVLELQMADPPHTRSRIVMEKAKEDWEIVRELGALFPLQIEPSDGAPGLSGTFARFQEGWPLSWRRLS
ncbi:MAG: FecR domain-containing protein, partial [Candidatus Sumerlaeota bacterium]|nr:FecR domain-containing protein [Candidatus Sumerlaeota bacterium]